MKISPVQGTPTIPQPSSTGLSPDKIARLKSIAQGGDGGVPQEQKSQDKKIRMNVNKTPEPVVNASQNEQTTSESVISDNDVQTKPTPEAIQQVSPEVAALAKRRRALQVKERELADKEKSLLATGQSENQLKTRAKSDALGVLQELGITYDQLTNELLGKQGNGDIDALKSEITSLKKTIDDKFTEKDIAQEQAVYSHMRKNVDKISSSSDEYRFIRESKSQDQVMELIKRTWDEDGEVLEEEEAMGVIEAELREDAKRYAKLIGEVDAPPPAQPAKQQQTGIKTLTNKDSARPLMTRRQRAIAAALGQK